jgi:hypothetical protein
MAIRTWFGFASALTLAFASVAVGCSDEGDDDSNQESLPAFGSGGTGGTANSPAGSAGTTGTGGTGAGQGGTAAAANGGTGGAPVTSNGGTGGAPGTGGTGAAGMGGTGNTAAGGTGTGGTGVGGTGGAPGVGGTAATGMGGTAPAADAVSFEDEVWPIFMARCGACHTTGRSGGQSVGSATLATAFADAVRVSPRLVGRLDGGGMPPGCNTAGTAPCIPLDDLQTVEDWVADGLAP